MWCAGAKDTINNTLNVAVTPVYWDVESSVTNVDSSIGCNVSIFDYAKIVGNKIETGYGVASSIPDAVSAYNEGVPNDKWYEAQEYKVTIDPIGTAKPKIEPEIPKIEPKDRFDLLDMN